MKKEVTIIGAGLVGSLLSIYLAKKGYQVVVYERRGDMRLQAVEAGRSINLALSDRGIKALQSVGIFEDVQPLAIPMHGRQIHNLDGSEAYQPYGKDGQFINSVSRRGLNCLLMDLAEKEGITFHFNNKLQHINFSDKTIQFEHQNQIVNETYEMLFAADGAYSAARLAHMLQHPSFNYEQFYIDCGYKELSIPAGANESFLLEKNALHIWPRDQYMLIALPNTDGSFTGTLFFPFQGPLSFDSLKTETDVHCFFDEKFPDVVKLVPDLQQQFFAHPTSSLVTVKCYPWIRDESFCLIGDAAHGIVPFFGQGMNAGFEDCRILNDLLDSEGKDWKKVLAAFQESRKPDADAIAALAIANFTEMGSKTADPKFLLQKKLEARLHQLYPAQWIPAYSQVTFSPEIRYSEALQGGQRQEAIMRKIMSQPGIEEHWESVEVAQQVLQMLRN